MAPRNDTMLEAYERETGAGRGGGELLFRIVAVCSLAVFGASGWYLETHNPPPRDILEDKAARARKVAFILEEKKKKPVEPVVAAVKKPEPPKPAPEEKKEPPPLPKEPIDLTKSPQLDQKVDDPNPENPPEAPKEPVRRVYGLRKVYSTGLGEGGTAADAVIGKLGNTLATDIDTFTAKKEELKGSIAPITTVQTLPKLKTAFKPEYTQEMIDNEVEGVIKANLLIDIDGKVKKAIVLNDLGYGSKAKVHEACLRLEFEPATVNKQPVAVWNTMTFRFELTE